MPVRDIKVDAVVVGAGTAGANAAYQLAKRGMSVVLVERRPSDRGGAHWHNGVLDWQFERAGLRPPEPPERVAEGGAAHVFAPDGRHGVTVSGNPVVTADMALLGRRLRSLAAEAGVEILDHAMDLSVDTRGGRIVAVEARAASVGSAAGPVRLEAPLFVDASGRRGVLRRTSAVLDRWCPAVGGDELCSAGDYQMFIDDPEGAKRFLNRFGVNAGEAVNVVGLNGGFSTRAITVSDDLETVAVLVGCLADGRNGSAPRMLESVRADEPWIGDPFVSGTGVIPLRRPYARFTAPGLALVGDAACQVFPAHGSGIGMGLIGARMLADAVADAPDPGDEHVLWRYQADFQREFGGSLAAYDGIRRMSTALGGDGVATMLRAGLITEGMTRSGLDQVWESLPRSELPTLVSRMARQPRLVARMLPMLGRAQLAGAQGPRYPDEVDETALAQWDGRVRRLLGDRST